MIELKNYIKEVPDFPSKGILFRDITPLLQNNVAYTVACNKLAEFALSCNANLVMGPESRGFIFGCPVAIKLNVGFVPIRKPGKLPREVISEEYDLEYGSNTLCIHADSIKPGDKVVIIDDLLATGGTVKAAINLVEKLGGEVAGVAFLIELKDLGGRKLLEGYNVYSELVY